MEKPLKIVTWNVNSLNARADFVALYLDAEAPDVFCIQELKLPEDRVPVELFEERGYHVEMHAQPRWNGVLIASKRPIEDVWAGLPEAVDEGEARMVSGVTSGIRFVNLYCPQGQSVDSPKFPFKLGFFKGLRAYLAERCDFSQPLIVLGDINIAPNEEDVYSVEAFEDTPSFHPKEHEEWDKLLELGLTDVVRPHIEPGSFSFWDYRGGAFRFNHGMRIDHILVSAPLVDRVASAWIDRDWRKKKQGLTASDHAPVGIELVP